MKKLAMAAFAAVIATVGMTSVAAADHRRGGDDEIWRKHDRGDRHAERRHWRHGDHHGWRRHHWRRHHGPRIVFRGDFYDDYCFVKKVRLYDDWGNMYIKRVRICH